MADTHTQFTGSIPQIYDRHLGPLLFFYYARDLARRIQVEAPARVLEVACGTGISTEYLREALDDDVEIVATDLNPAMLEFASEFRGGLANVRFSQADAMELPFGDAEFDAAICQFGVMFFPDKPRGIAEIARVVKPGGTLALNVWDSLDANPVVKLAKAVTSEFFDSDPPQFLALPFGYHDVDELRQLLAGAGFTGIEVERVATTVERPSARDVAVGFVEGNPGIHEINERATVAAEVIVDAVADALAHEFGDGPIACELRAIVATGQAGD
jgi:ubiquinone/menaquinone biosynthesis C-methylase UbiE